MIGAVVYRHAGGERRPRAALSRTLAACSAGRIAEIRLRFLSPVAFRRDDKDYPMPDPAFIFSSLADKWQQAAMPVEMDRAWIREAAAKALLAEWQGGSRRVYYKGKGGMAWASTRSNHEKN